MEKRSFASSKMMDLIHRVIKIYTQLYLYFSEMASFALSSQSDK